MLSVQSVFRRPDGATLSNADEAAHVVAAIYDRLGVTSALKKIFWLKVLGIAGCALGIILLVGALITEIADGGDGLIIFLVIVGLLFLAVGFGMIIASMRIVLPVVRTTRLTRLPWEVSLHPLNGRTIVVDESGFLPSSRFEFPSTEKSFGDIQDLMEEIANLVRLRPVLMDRMKSSRTALEFDPLKGQEEVLIRDYLDELADAFGNTDVKVVNLPALENSSPVIGFVDRGIQDAPNVSVPHVFQGNVDRDTGQKIEILDSLSRRRAYPELDTGQRPDPDLQRPDRADQQPDDEGNAQHFDDFFEETNKQLDDMGVLRTKGLVGEVLGDQIQLVGQASGSAMRHYYCRNCFTKDLSPSTTGSPGSQREIGQPTTSGNIRSSEEFKDKITQVERLIYSSRLRLRRMCKECRRPASERDFCSSCQRSKTKEGTDIIGQFWSCPLCGHVWDAKLFTPQDYFVSTLKIKEEIVLPLWDILWSELAVEKVRIISQKEEQQRENNNLEDNELEGMAREFAQDRRLLRTRLDDLSQTSITASSTLKGVITSFRDKQIINAESAKAYLERADQYNSNHQASIDRLRNYLTEQEDRVTWAVESRRGAKGKEDDKRSTMIDPSDELKLNGRFLFDYAKLLNPYSVELGRDPSSDFGAYLVFRYGDKPMTGAEVSVNGRKLESTDEDGIVDLSLLPGETQLKVNVVNWALDLEYETVIQLDAPDAGSPPEELPPIQPSEYSPEIGSLSAATQALGRVDDAGARLDSQGSSLGPPMEEEEEFEDDITIEIVGDPSSGGRVYLVLANGGKPMTHVEVFVNGDRLGLTDLGGRIPLSIPPGETLLQVRVVDSALGQEFDAEIQLSGPAPGPAPAPAPAAIPTMSPYGRPGTAELSEDVAEDEVDEFGEDMEIEIVGDPATDANVYLVLTAGGEPISGMEVTVNGDEVGPTDANGRVQLTLSPEETLLRLRISDAGHEQEFEAEIKL